jgi:hypothetical protein
MKLNADIIEAMQCLRMWLKMYRKEAGTWKPGKKTVGDDEVVEDINPWG